MDNENVLNDLTAKVAENKVYIDRLEAILEENNLPLPDRERYSQIRYAEELIGKRLLKDGSREEIQSLLNRLKKLYRPLTVEVQFKNLSFWTMASKPVIPTVGSELKNIITGFFKKKNRVDILKDLTGRLAPYKMTLLLGPPGSGRTVFMKALSGRLKPVAAKLEGDILFNGDSVQSGKFLVPKVADYIEQNDTHAATLTVQETVQYAWESATGGNHSYAVASDPASSLELNEDDEHYTMVQNIITALGLTGCKDTYVGDAMIKGISGGQKRRVTTAEMLTLPRPVKFMDAISNGLDSATTFDIVRALSEMSHIMGNTFCVSLLQPSPEVYNMFDEVILLSEGQIIYHGPREEILPYFEDLGYVCPPHVDEADFLQELPTNEGKRYIVRKEGRITPRGTEQLTKAFKDSFIYKRMLDEMEKSDKLRNQGTKEDGDIELGSKAPEEENDIKVIPWPKEMQEAFSKNFFYHFNLTFWRQNLLTMRDVEFLQARIGQNLIIGAISGSLYANIDVRDVGTMNGFLFFTLLFSALASFAMLPVVFAHKAVYYKHADASLFPTAAYTISQAIVLFPLQLLETIVFSAVVYWPAGLSANYNGSRFFIFVLLMYIVGIVLAQLFRLTAFFTSDVDSATPASGLMLMLMLLFCGFIQPKSQISNGWIWFYYINPIAWGIKAVTINEFKSPKYDFMECLNDDCSEQERFGDYVLKQYGNPTDENYIWYAVAVLFGEYLLFILLSAWALKYLRTEAPPRAVILQEEDNHNDSKEHMEDAAANIKGSELPYEPVTFAFKDINYTVTLPNGEDIELLKGVSGFFEPGVVNALMGSSGAGKTTLLDVLSGRKNTGVITGEMFVNGVPKNENHFRRIMGYVEQFDSLSQKATARENIEFSAALRLAPNITAEQRHQWVNAVLEMLELTPLENTLVGTIEMGGMSFEQRKRVSIGVELAANPSILFLDEPTTGLDSRAAQVIIRNIRTVAASGRCVVCTIHQPSTPIFFSFDSLLLLKKGGQTVFFGELGKDCVELIRYFEQIPDVPPIRQHQNPAVWMLEVIGAGTSAATNDTDFHAQYNHSGLCEANEIRLKGLIKDPNDPEYQSTRESMKMNEMPTKGFNATYWTQFTWLGYRTITTYWRTPVYNLVRFLINIIFALVFGSAYPNFSYNDNVSLISLPSVIYITTTFCGIISMLTVVPVVFADRGVFYREQQSNMYSIAIYTFWMVFIEIPYAILTSLAFVIPFFYIVGFQNTGNETYKFLWYWLFHFLISLLLIFLGQFCAVSMPDEQGTQVITGLIMTTFDLFCGFLITQKTMLPFWLFMYWVNPFHYTLEGLIFTQFHDDHTIISVGTEKMTAEAYLEKFYDGWSYTHVWYDILALCLITFMCALGTFVSLTFLRHQKR